MSKNLKIGIYTFAFVSVTVILFLILILIKASYGGLKLNVLNDRISKSINSSFAVNVEIDDIILKRDNEMGLYIEIKKLKAIGMNNLVLETDSLNWDFSILNVLKFTIDKNNKIFAQQLTISNTGFQILIKDLKTDFDKFDNIKLSIKSVDLRNVSNYLNFIMTDSQFSFSTNSIFKILNSEINLISGFSINNEKYKAELEYIPVSKQINILKFIGNNFFINDQSTIQFDTKNSTAKLKLDIKSKKDPIIRTLRLSNDSRIFRFVDSFKEWQSIILKSNFKYNKYEFLSELIDNINLKISGLYEMESLLPKDKFYTNFGNITNYEIDFYNEKDKYIIDVNSIKNDQISLKKGSFFKINKEFNIANINLVTSIDKNAAINFLKTTILSRESDTGQVVEFLNKNLNKKNDVVLNFNINPSSSDIIKSLKNLYVISSGKLNSDFIFDDNENPNFISGPINYYVEIKDLETTTPKLTGQIDLTEVKAFIRQINFQKDIDTSFKIKFEGKPNSLNDSLITFDSLDSEINLNAKVKVTKTNHIFLEKLSINNDSNVKLDLSGDLSRRVLNLKIKGDIIDLSKNKVDTKRKDRTYYLKEENYSINTDNVIFADLVQVNDFRAVIEKKGSKISVNSQAKFKDHELNYSREKNNDFDVNIINSTDITYFLNSSHPARKLLSNGELKMTSVRNLESQKAKVDIDLNNFVLINTPASLKLLSLPSISGLVSVAEGEQGIRFGYGEIKYTETMNEFSEIEAFAVSDSLGLIMEGNIDRKEKILNMKGEISPMHLVNAIIQKLPILGPLIVGGEGEGMFSIDFTMTGSSEDPDVETSPLTIIKPRIIERAIEALDDPSAIQELP